MKQKPVIISTEASRYFSKELLKNLSEAEFIDTERKYFGDGEKYYRIMTQQRDELLGRDVILVASTHTDDDFAEVMRVGTAAAQYGAHRLIFVMPFFGYASMERASRPGEVVTAKVHATQLSNIPQGDTRNVFFMLDLHTAGLVNYFEGSSLRFELYAEKIFLEAIKKLNLKSFIFASADLGRPRWVTSYANHFQTDVAFIRKVRQFEDTKIDAVIGEVENKIVIIYDDMIRSGSTLINAANLYLDRGAKEVYAIISHLALNDIGVVKKIESSSISKIITTNSHPMSQIKIVKNSKKFEIMDVSELFCDAIKRLFR